MKALYLYLKKNLIKLNYSNVRVISKCLRTLPATQQLWLLPNVTLFPLSRLTWRTDAKAEHADSQRPSMIPNVAFFGA